LPTTLEQITICVVQRALGQRQP